MFRRLAVFVGGFTLEAAEAVWSRGSGDDGGDGTDLDVLDGVASLADKSLLRQWDDPRGEPRFRDAGDDPRVRAGAAGHRQRG